MNDRGQGLCCLCGCVSVCLWVFTYNFFTLQHSRLSCPVQCLFRGDNFVVCRVFREVFAANAAHFFLQVSTFCCFAWAVLATTCSNIRSQSASLNLPGSNTIEAAVERDKIYSVTTYINFKFRSHVRNNVFISDIIISRQLTFHDQFIISFVKYLLCSTGMLSFGSKAGQEELPWMNSS